METIATPIHTHTYLHARRTHICTMFVCVRERAKWAAGQTNKTNRID